MNNIWIPPIEDRNILIYYCISSFNLQPQDADDVIQEAMIRYWKYYAKNEREIIKSPKSLFYTVLKSVILNHKRASRISHIELDENLLFLENHITSPDLIDFEKVEKTAENYINSLTGDVKTVISLFTEGKTQNEIVRLTHILPDRVKNILRKDRDLGRILKQIEIDYPL